MSEIKKINEQELNEVSGGVGANGWATVTGLQSGYLALRTAPCYDYNNEIRGSESYNGQQTPAKRAFILSATVVRFT